MGKDERTAVDDRFALMLVGSQKVEIAFAGFGNTSTATEQIVGACNKECATRGDFKGDCFL